MILENTTFGVEIEFVNADLYEVEQMMQTLLQPQGISLEREHYNHSTRRHWKLVSDATVSSGSRGGELVSPVLRGQGGLDELKAVLEALNACEDVSVNFQCGVHVHVKPDYLTVEKVKSIYKRYAENETQIDMWMPPSRRGNSSRWCNSIISDLNSPSFENFSDDLSSMAYLFGTRYKKVNLQSLSRYGTIEFRQHAGSTDYVKISNWIKFLVAFCSESESSASVSTTYKRTRKIAYGEIREQVAQQGWDLRYSGNKYKLFDSDGNLIETLTFQQLDSMYETSTARRTLNQDFVNWFSGHFGSAVVSIFSGVDSETVNFLTAREAHFNRLENIA